jgi:hypothetical protein
MDTFEYIKWVVFGTLFILAVGSALSGELVSIAFAILCVAVTTVKVEK